MVELHKNEKIVLKTRRHILPFALEAAALLIAAAIPFLILGLIGSSLGDFLPDDVSRYVDKYFSTGLFAAFLLLFTFWMTFAVMWTDYYLDVLLITSKRVIDIEQKGLFSRDVAELRLENIQDMKVEVAGIIPSLLRYGDLHIQTASENKEFVIKTIPDPDKVKDVISKEHDRALS